MSASPFLRFPEVRAQDPCRPGSSDGGPAGPARARRRIPAPLCGPDRPLRPGPGQGRLQGISGAQVWAIGGRWDEPEPAATGNDRRSGPLRDAEGLGSGRAGQSSLPQPVRALKTAGSAGRRRSGATAWMRTTSGSSSVPSARPGAAWSTRTAGRSPGPRSRRCYSSGPPTRPPRLHPPQPRLGQAVPDDDRRGWLVPARGHPEGRRDPGDVRGQGVRQAPDLLGRHQAGDDRPRQPRREGRRPAQTARMPTNSRARSRSP